MNEWEDELVRTVSMEFQVIRVTATTHCTTLGTENRGRRQHDGDGDYPRTGQSGHELASSSDRRVKASSIALSAKLGSTSTRPAAGRSRRRSSDATRSTVRDAPMELNWSVSTDGGTTWLSAGETKNQTYVTWNSPSSVDAVGNAPFQSCLATVAMPLCRYAPLVRPRRC